MGGNRNDSGKNDHCLRWRCQFGVILFTTNKLKMNLVWHKCFKWIDIFLPCFGSEICYLSPTKMLPTLETFIEIISLHLNEPVDCNPMYRGVILPWNFSWMDTPQNDANDLKPFRYVEPKSIHFWGESICQTFGGVTTFTSREPPVMAKKKTRQQKRGWFIAGLWNSVEKRVEQQTLEGLKRHPNVEGFLRMARESSVERLEDLSRLILQELHELDPHPLRPESQDAGGLAPRLGRKDLKGRSPRRSPSYEEVVVEEEPAAASRPVARRPRTPSRSPVRKGSGKKPLPAPPPKYSE